MTGVPPAIDRVRIRVKALVLLPNAACTHHAVWGGDDETRNPSSFHRLLGGSVEFGRPMWVEWRRLDGVGEDPPLYPADVQKLIDASF